MSNPSRLKELFAEVAPTYERLNLILTFGLDRRMAAEGRPAELVGILREAGFAEMSRQRFLFGATAVHLAVKG
jgi:ubiquinone/menaquinone biosynthesis C-methylase UbiE